MHQNLNPRPQDTIPIFYCSTTLYLTNLFLLFFKQHFRESFCKSLQLILLINGDLWTINDNPIIQRAESLSKKWLYTTILS